jgi:hypothetical protein
MGELPEYVGGLPNLYGWEPTVEAAVAAGRHRPVFLDGTAVEVAGIDSAFGAGLPAARARLAAPLRRGLRPEALGRVRGFAPAEMALPNHPDVAYEFVKTLNDCGYQWLLVQEHTVEVPDGRPLQRPHLPHRLVCTSSRGDTAEIVAVVKTQGSDTKLVGQMQPYSEAKGLSGWELAGRRVPPLVTQIADGENGGVMMNEFPPKYLEVVGACSGSRTPIVNVTEYLEQLFATGVRPADLAAIRPLFQHRIWQQMAPGDGPDRLASVVEQLRIEIWTDYGAELARRVAELLARDP